MFFAVRQNLDERGAFVAAAMLFQEFFPIKSQPLEKLPTERATNVASAPIATTPD